MATGTLDNASEGDKRERTSEEIFQSVAEWCREDYKVEEIRYSMESRPIGIGEPMKDGMEVTKEEAYDVVIYMDASTLMLERGY